MQEMDFISKLSQAKEEPVSQMAKEEKKKLLLMKLRHKLVKDSKSSGAERFRISNESSTMIFINPAELGAIFVNLLKDTLKIRNKYDVQVPLIDVKMKSEDKLTYARYFTIHNSLLDKVGENVDDINMLHLDKALPMILRPAKWIDFEIGGYYLKPTNMVRIETSQEQEEALRYADLGRTFKILDTLASTPWKINKKVLGVVEDIWNSGSGASCVPAKKNPNSNVVYEHEALNYYGKERLKFMKELQLQKDAHGIRCDFLLKLAVVKSFQDVESFYYPMTLDFRGRVYPVSPHFNHIGADLSRGLLKFGEKKKIEARGLRWLRIHCANLMGLDKKPIGDKLAFIDNNLDLIRSMAENPLENR